MEKVLNITVETVLNIWIGITGIWQKKKKNKRKNTLSFVMHNNVQQIA